MNFKKPVKPQPEPKPHLFATCREVATLLDMARTVMHRTELGHDDRFAIALLDHLHSAQALADRIGYGHPRNRIADEYSLSERA